MSKVSDQNKMEYRRVNGCEASLKWGRINGHGGLIEWIMRVFRKFMAVGRILGTYNNVFIMSLYKGTRGKDDWAN